VPSSRSSTAPSPCLSEPLHVGRLGRTEADELAVTHALLRQASAGDLVAAHRVHSPATPTVVFGRRDTRLPGFAAAVAAAREHGFDTAVRVVGGRAVAYTPRCVVVDHVRREPRPGDGMQHRFEAYGRRCAAALAALGVDARVGAVPGEYCPGEQSINARGVVKLVGTAQRVVRDAWLFSALAVVDDRDAIRAVLVDVYARLGLPYDPASVGSLATERDSITPWQVGEALLAAGGAAAPTPTAVDAGTLELAAGLVRDHVADGPPP
jgi:octanoyl-[GcvH]:protein N-octanoyltransferase